MPASPTQPGPGETAGELAIIDETMNLAAMNLAAMNLAAMHPAATHPEGLKSPADRGNLRAALLRRGFSAEDTAKVIGANVQRVMDAVLPRVS